MAESPGSALSTDNPSLLIADPTGTVDNAQMYLSGTSIAAPAVTGTAALLLQVNPRLTPNMVRMLVEYTAQPIAGATTFDQGAGELNVDGAVRLARSLRTDLDFSTAAMGTTISTNALAGSLNQSTIGLSSFAWSQVVIGNHNITYGPAADQ